MKTIACLVAAAALLAPAAAFAHAHAKSTEPAEGATLKGVHEIKIAFTEDVKPAFTGAELIGGGGAVKLGKPAFDDGKTHMTVPVLGAVKGGTYTVRWHAVAGDGHRSTGQFGFAVAP